MALASTPVRYDRRLLLEFTLLLMVFFPLWNISVSAHANHEHLPGLVLGDAGHEDLVVGPVPARSRVDADVAAV